MAERRIEVTRCRPSGDVDRSCPFVERSRGYGYYCAHPHAPPHYGDEIAYPYTPPAWCPLRPANGGPVLVVLRGESDE